MSFIFFNFSGWGSNYFGQIALENEQCSPTPQMIFEGCANYIDAGYNSSFIITENDYSFCCGDNQYGQLGLGRKFSQIASGINHTLFLTDLGQIYSTGNNTFGQLGTGNKKDSNTIVGVCQNSQNQNFIYIAAGNHSAAINQVGQLYIWGTGIFGEYLYPNKFLNIDSEIVQLEIGNQFGAALDQTGRVWTWGQNEHGQLGVGDQLHRKTPFPVSAIKKKYVTQLACGSDFLMCIGQQRSQFKNEDLDKTLHTQCSFIIDNVDPQIIDDYIEAQTLFNQNSYRKSRLRSATQSPTYNNSVKNEFSKTQYKHQANQSLANQSVDQYQQLESRLFQEIRNKKDMYQELQHLKSQFSQFDSEKENFEQIARQLQLDLEKSQESQEKYEQTKQQLSDLQFQVQESNSKIQSLNHELSDYKHQVQLQKHQGDIKNQKIGNLEKKLEILQEKLKKQQDFSQQFHELDLKNQENLRCFEVERKEKGRQIGALEAQIENLQIQLREEQKKHQIAELEMTKFEEKYLFMEEKVQQQKEIIFQQNNRLQEINEIKQNERAQQRSIDEVQLEHQNDIIQLKNTKQQLQEQLQYNSVLRQIIADFMQQNPQTSADSDISKRLDKLDSLNNTIQKPNNAQKLQNLNIDISQDHILNLQPTQDRRQIDNSFEIKKDAINIQNNLTPTSFLASSTTNKANQRFLKQNLNFKSPAINKFTKKVQTGGKNWKNEILKNNISDKENSARKRINNQFCSINLQTDRDDIKQMQNFIYHQSIQSYDELDDIYPSENTDKTFFNSSNKINIKSSKLPDKNNISTEEMSKKLRFQTITSSTSNSIKDRYINQSMTPINKNSIKGQKNFKTINVESDSDAFSRQNRSQFKHGQTMNARFANQSLDDTYKRTDINSISQMREKLSNMKNIKSNLESKMYDFDQKMRTYSNHQNLNQTLQY